MPRSVHAQLMGETMTNSNEQVIQLGHHTARDFNHLCERQLQGDLGKSLNHSDISVMEEWRRSGQFLHI